MAGLTDMEELVGTVDDRDVASFLREALACYGAGAHRACVVLTNIALFDSLRRKLKALSPVNGVAKRVSHEIESLATAQKVFETPLIHKLKAAGIITQLEAQTLEQLNAQRNKAAHPSGHTVTPEEARFVFAEAIKKFISQPIRETSYVVDTVVGKFVDQNFFPSGYLSDMVAVLGQELANLDPAAKPFLIERVIQSLNETDATIAGNARNFLLALVAHQKPIDRLLIINGFLDPKSSDPKSAELVSMMVATDPALLSALEPGTKLRVKKLLMLNADAVGVALPYQELKHPAHVLGSCVKQLGETFVLAEFEEFCDWVIGRTPYAPELLSTLTQAPVIFSRLYQNYLARAKSTQFAISNAFAAAVSALDAPLAGLTTDEQAFTLLAAVMKGADWGGHVPTALVNSSFNSLPALKGKARSFADANPAGAASALTGHQVIIDLETFRNRHFA